MSTEKYLLILASAVAFLLGVLLTLILTGSVKAHWAAGAPTYGARPPTPTAAPTSAPVPVEAQRERIAAKQTAAANGVDSQKATAAELAQYDLSNIDPEDFLVVPVGTDPKLAREKMLEEFSKVPAVTFGEGENDIYVLYDPLCPHCHNFLRTLENGAHAKYNLKSHWIPAIVFQDDPRSVRFSQKITTAVQAGEADRAKEGYLALVNGNPEPLMDNSWQITPEAAMRVARNTVGMMQIIGGQKGAGTPVVIYRNKEGEVEIVTGELLDTDFPAIGKARPGST